MTKGLSAASKLNEVVAGVTLDSAGPAPEGRRIVARGGAVRRNRGWKGRLGKAPAGAQKNVGAAALNDLDNRFPPAGFRMGKDAK